MNSRSNLSSTQRTPRITAGSVSARQSLFINHFRNRSRPWLQNLESVGPSPGPKHFYQDISRRSIHSLRATLHSAARLDQADSQPFSDSLLVPSQHAEHISVCGTSATRPSPHSVIKPNPVSTELSLSARHGLQRGNAIARVVSLHIFPGSAAGCGVGIHSQAAGAVPGREASRVIRKGRTMLPTN